MLSDIEILKQLKAAYDSHKLSALVGAGFTKNAYPDSPTWPQLMKDLIVEAYDDEIKQRYADYLHTNTDTNVKTLGDCIESYVNDILKREGFLDVVSTFIKKKGFREAIDVYIEEHNPYVYKETTGKNDIMVWGNPNPIPEKNLEIHEMLLKCNWNNVFTTNYDNFLEFTDKLLMNKYDKVVKDFQLSQQNNKLIIKIHGDLVRKDKTLDEPFEFDNDKTRRYIISKEDYDTYFKKHEAFSYYMRTALLTGYYCLIGFSGADPNYKGWIEWVKDILDKDSDAKNKEKIKVFMIVFEDKKLPVEEEIFNYNHRIGLIHLFRKDVQDILRGKPGAPLLDHGGALKLLFQYLNPENVKSYNSTSGKASYNTLMGNLLSDKEKNLPITDNLDSIKAYIAQRPFPKILYFNENIIDYYLKNATGKLKKQDTDAFILAFKESGHYPSMISGKLQLNEHAELYPLWEMMIKREESYKGADTYYAGNLTDPDIYENVLRCLFHLNFSEARKILKRWKPSGEWIVKRVALNSMFVGDKEIDQLIDFIKGEWAVQWRYFALTLYNFIHHDYKAALDDTEYVKARIENFYEIMDYLEAQVAIRKDIPPLENYGETTTRLFFGDDKALNKRSSLRLLNLYAETGYPFSSRGVSNMSIIEWYDAFSFLVIRCPYACLFYCSQFGDARLLSRYGQDFAYSDGLRNELPNLLRCCIRAISDKDVPLANLNGILRLSTEFYVAVKEDEWFDEWIKVVKKYYVGDKNQYLYSTNLRANVKTACAYLTNPKHISSTFTAMLNMAKEDGKHIIDMYPGYLRIRLLDKLNSRQVQLLDEIVETIPIDESNFLLWRVYDSKLMPEHIVRNIVEAISVDGALHNVHPFELERLAMIVKNSQKGVQLVKQEILRRDIWSNGISGEWATDPEYVPILELPRQYKWTKDEFAIINKSLIENFEKLKKSYVIKDVAFKHSCEDLLTEMLAYVEKYNKVFDCLPAIEEVKEVLAFAREWESIEDGLYSDDSNFVDKALETLSVRIRKNGFKGEDDLVDIVIDHVLQRNVKGLTSATNLLSYICHKGAGYYLKDEKRRQKLLRVLATYKGKDLRDYNMWVVTALHSFIYIAEALRNVGMDDEVINWWLSDDIHSRFNFRERFYWDD